MQEWIIKYWLEALFGAIIGILVYAYRQLACQVKKQDAIRLGMMALLWDCLFRIYNECEKAGCISIDALKNANNIYKQYHALGGNGVGTELFERLCALPTSKTRCPELSEEREGKRQ